MAAAANGKTDHICVLVHGLWGNPGHMNYLCDAIKAQYGEELHVFLPTSNKQYNTYDGIEVGAERIAHEIEREINRLSGEGIRLAKISVIGYSLGGLIARYMVGLLYKDGVFDRLQPVNFTTFASPWIGVKSPNKGVGGTAWNVIVPRTLSISGRQMFCMDKFRDTGKPLLSVMSDPSSIFMYALRRFKKKSLYANTLNDRSVPFYTAAFLDVNPFTDLESIDVHYLPGQKADCILNPTDPVTIRDKSKHGSPYERFKARSSRFGHKLPYFAFITLFFPVAATVMLVNAGYQTYKSSRRIHLHETGKALVDPKKYRIALLEETQALQDRTLERFAANQKEHYLPTPPPETAQSSDDDIEKVDDDIAWAEPFPKLALMPEQFKMIEHLDELGFDKYFCHIQKHRHTHAAVIHRYENPNFGEGESVVRHWVEKFEI